MTTKCCKTSRITEGSTLHRIALAISLTSILPILSLTYLYMAANLHAGHPTLEDKELLIASIILMISAGVILLVDHAKSIGKLRQYTTAATRKVFSARKIKYLQTADLHDLKYIEKCLKFSLEELNRQLELLEYKHSVEHDLRAKIEQNQLMFRDMEDTFHQIESPATILRLRLSVMKKMDIPFEQQVQIEECSKEVDTILEILAQLEKTPEPRYAKAP